MEFCVIIETSKARLDKAINELLRSGWNLHGPMYDVEGVSIFTAHVQTLVKRD